MAEADPRIAVVPMRQRHLRGVVAIERQTNPRPWSRDLFSSELRMVGSDLIVAVIPSAVVVGFGCLMSTGFEAHVTNIAVDPMWHRRGIGTLLLRELLDLATARGLDDVTLEVRASNEPAKSMYRGFGFVEEGVRPRYYAETGEDALIMWRRGSDGTGPVG